MKYFDRQVDALKLLSETERPDRIGVLVYHRQDGKRRFCVCSWEKFITKYLTIDAGLRHFYEVVREDVPAKLHLDVDVFLQEGMELNTSLRIEILIKATINGLRKTYNLDVSRTEVLQMDSSTSEKCSQHIVFPTVVFANNIECGHFMKKLADEARQFLDAGEPSSMIENLELSEIVQLFVPRDGRLYFLCDLGIYTRNRQFRLWRSSKLGKNSYLEIADENQYWASTTNSFLVASLVTNVSMNTVNGPNLVCSPPRNHRPVKTPAITTNEATPLASSTPELDNFVMQQIRSDTNYEMCVISKVVEFKNDGCVLYKVKGSRWCQNVNRQHTSNRPYFCANLKEGTMYQMCHSRQCLGYRSQWRSIPLEIQGKYEIGDEAELLKLFEETDPMPVL